MTENSGVSKKHESSSFRPRHLMGKQFTLYHGTDAALSTGDVIAPGYATSDSSQATMFARHRLTEGNERQLALFNPVYTVKPVDPRNTKEVYQDYFRSPSGFRVTGIDSWQSERPKKDSE